MLPRLVPALCLAIAACGQVDYGNVKAGEFTGTLFVMWVGEGNDTGDGRFVFVPNPRDPLRFNRAAAAASVRTIEPKMMYTDGGSIPRAGQLFKGFSPWGYAPAYMVHDWLFVARHCLNDEEPSDEHRKLQNVTFKESAEIIAEAIKTLVETGQVEENDVAARVISGVVAGPISYDRCVVKDECRQDTVSEDDETAANAAIPGASRAGLLGQTRLLPDGETIPLKPARIVATVSF